MADDQLPLVNKHPEQCQKIYRIGSEQAPLLVIDNFVNLPENLIDYAAGIPFKPIGQFFPGIRAPAPANYRQFLVASAGQEIASFFGLEGRELKLSLCHYSLVTTPRNRLSMMQRIPHFDSVEPTGLASVHYLFRGEQGGTAFYQHRKTGFESIDESRKVEYLRSLEAENGGPNLPQSDFINGDTALFTQIHKQDAAFNRIVIYRRNSLHSGAIPSEFLPDPNPRTGRLSINSFIDTV